MKDDKKLQRKLRLLAPAGLAVLAALLIATPTQAQRRHHGRHDDRSHRYQAHRDQRQHHDSRQFAHGDRARQHAFGHVRHDRRGLYVDFVVPRQIVHGHGENYRRFHHGSVYYRPHRHHHTVYNFPVYTDAAYVYQQHYYCQGALYQHPHRSGLHTNISIGFRF